MPNVIMSQEQRQSALSFLQRYINDKCIYRVPPGEKLLLGKAPGTLYSWQFYLRKGLFDVEFMKALSMLFLDKVALELGHFNFQLAGLETASTPMLVGIPMVASLYGIKLNAFSIRKERKNYGLHNWIEGRPNDKPVLLIDDLCNSTNSLRNALEIVSLNERLPVCNHYFTIINKSSHIMNDNKMPANMTSLYLFTLSDFGLSG